MITVNAQTLRDVAGDRSPSQASIIAALGPVLQPTLQEYSIDNFLRVAHWLGQICHESAGFSTTEEFASGEEYEGRENLGNTQPGDGPRYKGRGLIQLTGRANYRTYGSALGIDLEGNPERAAEPVLSLRIACEYWKRRDINPLCDADDIEAVTRKINGGLNGLADRRKYTEKAKEVLAAGNPKPAPPSPAPPRTEQGGGTYTVRPGDTLGGIAKRHGTDVPTLARLNNIANPDLIRVGDVLTLPGNAGGGGASQDGGTYTVRPGDTLGGIAKRHGTDVPTLARLNNIANPDLIRVGDVLTLPGNAGGGGASQDGGTYTVRPGDTLGGIAKRHGTDVPTLARLNNIANPDLIRVGDVLTLPGKASATPAPPPPPSSGPVRIEDGVTVGPVGSLLVKILGFYPKRDEIRITDAYRPNSKDHHGGLSYDGSPTAAIDIAGRSSGVTPETSRIMRDVAKWLYDKFGGDIVELIHTTPYADDRGFYVKNQKKNPGGSIYGAATRNAHKNHVHFATSKALAEKILAQLGA